MRIEEGLRIGDDDICCGGLKGQLKVRFQRDSGTDIEQCGIRREARVANCEAVDAEGKVLKRE